MINRYFTDGAGNVIKRIVVLMEDTCGNSACVYEHGLSVYVETEKHRILVDTGATDKFIENAAVLAVDLTRVDTVILSHGHYDHSGGIISFLQMNQKAQIYMQKNAGGDFYHGERYIGIAKNILSSSQVHLVEGESIIDDELSFFSGISGRRFYPKSNLLLSRRTLTGELIQDDFSHEQCLVVGDVLISGCAHNGILNILDRYKELYGKTPSMVISGFHMMKKGDYDEEECEIIQETARELASYKNMKCYTGHCTGQVAFDVMKEIMGDQLMQIHSGDCII